MQQHNNNNNNINIKDQSQKKRGFSFSHPKQPKILVVEDNLLCGVVLMKLMASIGFEPDWVTDGFQAMEKVQQSLMLSGGVPYSIILMDINMPGMDGLQTTENLVQFYSSFSSSSSSLFYAYSSSSSLSPSPSSALSSSTMNSETIFFPPTIIGMSNDTSSELKNLCLAKGMSQLISKPLSKKQLQETLKLYLHKFK